jgi:phosphoserine phosphatase
MSTASSSETTSGKPEEPWLNAFSSRSFCDWLEAQQCSLAFTTYQSGKLCLVGRKAEVAEITEAAMRGDIADYKDSLRRRVALLAGVPESALERVYEERLRLNPGVETFVAACQSAGLRTLLISGGFTHFSERIRHRLKLDFARANTLGVANGKLTGTLFDRPWGDIVDGAEKKRVVLEVCELMGITTAQAIAVGDGANDLPMMQAAGLSIAYHPKPAVAEVAMVSIMQGGLDRALEVISAE